MQTTNTAENILSQLGGSGRLKAMIGAHTFVGDDTTLVFKFRAKAIDGYKAIRVTLDPSDTYTVGLIAIRGLKIKTKDVAGVYFDNLVRVIESETGLRLSI